VDVAAGGGVHVVASYGDGFRSPQARDLAEGESVPFTKVRSAEVGVRLKEAKTFQGSIVGFGSWLGNDRVFDATSRQNIKAPASMRAGAQIAMAVRAGPFGANLSGTYTNARFTEGDATFKEGDPVPYAPAMVLRDDMYVAGKLTKLFGKDLSGRVGVGVEGIAGRTLPGGKNGKDYLCLDAVAAMDWRGIELALQGTNLLNLQYYDSQYIYVSNFEKSPTLPAPSSHVLTAAPLGVMLTVTVHIRGKSDENRQYY
jgi:iron complex outermembrane recepter protein